MNTYRGARAQWRVLIAGTVATVMALAGAGIANAVNDVGTVGPGRATVGDTIDFDPDDEGPAKEAENKQMGVCEVSGEGLFLLGLPNTINRQGFYSLSTAVVAMERGTGTLNICGELSPVGEVDDEEPTKPGKKEEGIGAACGMSQGHDGQGKIEWDDPDPWEWTELRKVGWLATAGGTLPVTGDAYDLEPSTNPSAKEKKKGGLLLAQVQAQGGDACFLDPNGAKGFDVVGAFELLQGMEKGDH